MRYVLVCMAVVASFIPLWIYRLLTHKTEKEARAETKRGRELGVPSSTWTELGARKSSRCKPMIKLTLNKARSHHLDHLLSLPLYCLASLAHPSFSALFYAATASYDRSKLKPKSKVRRGRALVVVLKVRPRKRPLG
jgi:hypothetical protein